MSTEITDYDTSEYLENEQDIIAYLNAIAEYDDPALMQAALGNVAKARGMTQIAKDAGVGRESLYKKPQQGRKPQLPDHRQGNPRPRRTPHHPSRLKNKTQTGVVVNPPRGILRIRISVKASGRYISQGLYSYPPTAYVPQRINGNRPTGHTTENSNLTKPHSPHTGGKHEQQGRLRQIPKWSGPPQMQKPDTSQPKDQYRSAHCAASP